MNADTYGNATSVPHPGRRPYTWLIHPEAKWLRLSLSFPPIAGGNLDFLSVLGFWMLPVSALLLGGGHPAGAPRDPVRARQGATLVGWMAAAAIQG